jgi:acyl carrier protein
MTQEVSTVMSSNDRSPDAIARYIQKYVSEILEVPSEKVSLTSDVSSLGLTSATLVGLVGELEDWLSVELSPAVLYDYPTIAEVSKYLSENAGQA